MQRLQLPWSAARLLSGRPDVGTLMALCEENFDLMLRLAPGLRGFSGHVTSSRRGLIDLHLEIEGQSPYTTQVRLTHFFASQDGASLSPDPDARLRVYHDARQIEVLELRQSLIPLRTDYAPPALADKWQANIFLSKWLLFCVREGHRFWPGVSGPASSTLAEPTSCLAQT